MRRRDGPRRYSRPRISSSRISAIRSRSTFAYGYDSFRNVIDPSLIGSGGAYANTDAGTTGNYTPRQVSSLDDRTTTDDVNSYTALPNSSASFPGGANNFYVANGQLRATGQLANNATIDGEAAFGTASP